MFLRGRRGLKGRGRGSKEGLTRYGLCGDPPRRLSSRPEGRTLKKIFAKGSPSPVNKGKLVA